MNNYQELAARTLIDKPDFTLNDSEQQLVQDILKLAVLTAECVENVKKGIFHQHGVELSRLNLKLMEISQHIQEVRSGGNDPNAWPRLTNEQTMIVWNTLGLVGEVGEVAEKVYQATTDNLRPDLFKELGDTSWYIAALCTKLDYNLDDVLEANIEKLKKRFPNGYSSEDSKKRVDTQGENQ